MDAWQHLMRQFVAAADDDDFVLVASLRQAGIAAPPVVWTTQPGATTSLTKGMRLLPDTSVMRRSRIRPIPRPVFSAATATIALAAVSSFGCGLSSPHSYFRAADIDLVDFDSSCKAIPTKPDHRSAQLVGPCPGGLVASQPQYPLQAQGAHAVLPAGHEPHREEPRSQRFTSVLKYRAGRH
jgi:hypothetical protein